MSAAEQKGISQRDAILQVRFRLIGVIILVGGLAAASAVDLTVATDDGILMPNSKRSEYQMEIIGGKSNILASEINEWFASLWHGRRLAQMLAIFSVGGSLACFFVAHRLGFPPVPGKPAAGKGA
jgi:hypothetical protein